MIAEYYDTARYIASQILKNYTPKDEREDVDPVIAIFYLEYAVLLTERCTKELIRAYLDRNSIGEQERLEEITEKLYTIGKKINKAKT